MSGRRCPVVVVVVWVTVAAVAGPSAVVLPVPAHRGGGRAAADRDPLLHAVVDRQITRPSVGAGEIASGAGGGVVPFVDHRPAR